jgi:3-oxoacyl-[acyl-carrier protein] reductase
VAIKADVTAPNDVNAMVDEIDERWGGIDVLVHNALMPFAVTSFAKLSWEQLCGKLDNELRAAFLTTKAVVPGMVSRGYGRLIYLSTGLSRHPRDGMITLGTAKAALDQFVRYVALELAPHGITANLVAPDTVEGPRAAELVTRTDAPACCGRADATAGSSRRGSRDGGVLGKRGVGFHHRPLPSDERGPCNGVNTASTRAPSEIGRRNAHD